MILIFLFLILYVILYVIKYKFYDYNNIFEKKNILINSILFFITLLYTFLTIYNETKSICGKPNITFYMFIPFIFIIIINFVFTNMFSGRFIQPFSNTIGYIYSLIVGLSDQFKKLLKSNVSDNLKNLIRIVNNKPNVCINEFTPFNINEKFLDFKEIVKSDVFNNDSLNLKNMDLNIFVDNIKKKHLFSEFIVLIIFIFVKNLWTKINITETKCMKDIKGNMNALSEDNNDDNKNKKVYNTN